MTDAPTTTALTVDGLAKAFPTGTAVDRLSFEAREHEFGTLVGPSGCGKSTTLRIIEGLLRPTSGTIAVGGRMADGPIPDAAMVFQSPVLLPWRRTVDNILFTAEMCGTDPAQHRRRAQELIRLAGLEGFERSYPHELSGGMQQRVALCRALLLDPSLLLMDEPFGALDVLTRERLGFELQRIWMTTRNTVLFVTHSITEAVLLSDRVIVMTGQPGREKATVGVDLPRSRGTKTLHDPRFLELADRVRDQMEAQWVD